jgi:hypothetical protein
MLGGDPTPAPHSRVLSVRADDPTSGDAARGKLHIARSDRYNGAPPEKLHAAVFSTRDESFVQSRTPQTHANARRKVTRDAGAPLSETDAAKIHAVSRSDRHAEIAERCDRFRHHPFATRFLNRGRRAIRKSHFKTLLAGSNRSRQARGASANYEYIGGAW